MPRVPTAQPNEQSRQKELKKIEAYKGLVSQVNERVSRHQLREIYTLTNSQINAKDYTGETLILTSNLLHQNPEYYTIWNCRRLILQDAIRKELSSQEDGAKPKAQGGNDVGSERLSEAQREIHLILKEDLTYTLPLLQGYPKCYWIWNHRRWLLNQTSESLPVPVSLVFWREELGLVSKMLNYDSRNFHGWSYRREVVRELERLGSQEDHDSTDRQTSMVESEFAYTTKMIKTNLSNFSAWHNRSQLIPRLLDERKADNADRRKLLDAEIDFITQALYTDPSDQSLWFYHQFLMNAVSTNPHPTAAFMPGLTNQDRLESVSYTHLTLPTKRIV